MVEVSCRVVVMVGVSTCVLLVSFWVKLCRICERMILLLPRVFISELCAVVCIIVLVESGSVIFCVFLIVECRVRYMLDFVFLLGMGKTLRLLMMFWLACS